MPNLEKHEFNKIERIAAGGCCCPKPPLSRYKELLIAKQKFIDDGAYYKMQITIQTREKGERQPILARGSYERVIDAYDEMIQRLKQENGLPDYKVIKSAPCCGMFGVKYSVVLSAQTEQKVSSATQASPPPRTAAQSRLEREAAMSTQYAQERAELFGNY